MTFFQILYAAFKYALFYALQRVRLWLGANDSNNEARASGLSETKRSRKKKPVGKLVKRPSPEHRIKSRKNSRFTHIVALDCEMVGIGNRDGNMLARVAIVNSRGQTLYDTFVKPTEPVVDYRTDVSGVRPRDLENAVDFQTAQKQVARIIKGRILVGHALESDFSVLSLRHPSTKIRDTSKFKPFRDMNKGRSPSLKKLALGILGVRIQTGEHNPVEDAWAAMQLYKLYRGEWFSYYAYSSRI